MTLRPGRDLDSFSGFQSERLGRFYQMKTNQVTFRLQNPAWRAEIAEAIAGSKALGKGRWITEADWFNDMVAEALNHRERSAGKPQTHVYVPGDVRNGRPRRAVSREGVTA